jgi:prophage regulatory protein
MNTKLVKLKGVMDCTGLSRSSIYAMMKSGDFPKSISIGARAIAWADNDIQSWINSRISASK